MSGSELHVCFVCLGNICRSPTAEGVMERLVREAGLEAHIRVESAGTAAYHVGKRADERARAAARGRGLDLTSRARQFAAGDFARFDLVVAMDRENAADLLDLAEGAEERRKVVLLRSLEPDADARDVPDPYYGGDEGFEEVLDICERACRSLLERLVREHGLR